MAEQTTADIPQLASPFRFYEGKPVVVEQDSDEEVRQCVATLARTRIGQRAEHPDYGVSDPSFRREADLDELRAQIQEWEPRADVVLGQTLDTATLIAELDIGVEATDG
jgi:phage baseplate assembly protein W